MKKTIAVARPLMALALLSIGLTNFSVNALAGQESVSSAESRDRRPFDVKFIDEMTTHHLDGIEMAKIAIEKSFHKELREMAKKMMTDQQRDIQKMSEWRERFYPGIRSFDKKGVGMNMGKLRSKSGVEFDLAFLDSMITHHPGAIYLGLEVTQRGQVRDIRDFGQNTANKQLNELDKMRSQREAWAGH